MDNMTLTVIFLIFTAGIIVSSKEQDQFALNNNVNNIYRNNDVCLQSNIICPPIDGNDSIYGSLPDCTKFCQCSNGVPYLHNCPEGLHFNPNINVCDWPENAGCTGGNNPTTTATQSNTTTESTSNPTTTTEPNICTEAGILCPAVDGPDSVYGALPDCTKFCQCSNGVPYVHNCPFGLHFNPVLNVCDWPENAGCGQNTNTTAAATTTTQAPNPTTEVPETTTSNECIQANITCPAVDGPDSIYGALPDCTKFCQCSNGVPYVHNCPFGLHFNPVLNVCDWPENAGCGQNTNTTAAATTTTQAPNPTTEVPETTTSNECIQANIICPAVDGPDSVYGALPDCTKFCQCSNGVPYVHNCPFGLHFNPVLNVCDWPENAGCGQNTNTTAAATTTTQAPNPTTEVPETTTSNECIQANINCPAVDGPDSIYGALPDCTKFCQCSNGVPYVHNCPFGLHFNPVLNVCDWPENAGCGQNTNTTAAATTTTQAPNPTTEVPETTTSNECIQANINCPAVDGPDSIYGALPDCTKFCQCSNGVPYVHNCPFGLLFNPVLNVCDWPENAGCGQNTNTTAAATTTTQAPNPTTEVPETTTSNECIQANINCPAVDGPDSIYGALPDCTKFCQCSNGVPYVHNCPFGLHFNPVLNVCDWPENAGCGQNTNTTAAATTTTQAPNPTTEVPETTTSNECIQANINCPAVDGPDSIYGALPDCTKFCQCSNGVPYVHNCPFGLHFNPVLNVCDWPENAGCGQNTNTTAAATTTTQAPNPTTEVPETTTSNECIQANINCPAVDGPDSIYGALPDCTKFCQCSNGVPYVHNCPFGLHFNPVLNVCDWPENAGCGQNTNTTAAATTTTQAPNPTTEVPETTTSNECIQANINCPAVDGPDSIYGALPDCTKFCQCSNGVPYVHNCPFGLHFNPVLNVCDWPENAGCGQNTNTTAAATTTTQAPNPTTEVPETTTSNECIQANINCPAVDGPDSIYGALPDCTKFCQCSNGVPYVHNCPFGLHFNPVLNVCDWPENAGCGQNTNTTAAATTTTQAPNPTTEVPETTTSNECIQANIICPAVAGPDSVYGALPDCTKFCQCSNGVPYVHNCPFGLHFNPVLNVCDWPENAGCGQNTNTTAAATTTTQAPNPTTEVPETTTSNECIQANINCPAVDGPDSIYGALPDCTKFCQCSNGVPYVHNCPFGLHFNPVLNVCDWPENAGCGQNTNTTAAATTTTQAPNPTTEVPETTTSNECIQANIICPAVDGPDSVYGALPDCTKFCQCSNGVPYVHNCASGLHFNLVLNVCDWPENAGCNGNTNSTTASTEYTSTAENGETNTENSTTEANIITENGNSTEYIETTETYISTNQENFTTEVSITTENEESPAQNSDTTEADITTQNENSSTEDSVTTEKYSTPEVEISTGSTVTAEAVVTNDNGNTSSDEADTTENETSPTDGTITSEEAVSTEEETSTENSVTTEEIITTDNINTTQNSVTPTTEVSTENGSETDDSIPCSTVIITETIITTTVISGTEYCLQNNIKCPDVDGEKSVYGALPDCTKFCQCSNGIPQLHSCSKGLQFNPELNECVLPEYSGCSNKTSTSVNPNAVTEITTECNADDSTTEKTTSAPNTDNTGLPTNNTAGHDNTAVPDNDEDENSGTKLCREYNVVCPVVDPEYPVFTALPDCTKYCKCSNGTPYLFGCPANLHFNPDLNVCDWPQNAGCKTAS